MITDTMKVRCCVSVAEPLIDKVQPLGFGIFFLPSTLLIDVNTELCFVGRIRKMKKKRVNLQYFNLEVVLHYFKVVSPDASHVATDSL